MGSCCHFLLPAPRVFLVFCFSPVLLPSLIFSLQLYHIGLMSIGLFPRQHLIPYLDEFVSKPVLFPQSLSVCLSVSCAPVPVCWSSCILCVPDFLMVSCLVRSFCIVWNFTFCLPFCYFDFGFWTYQNSSLLFSPLPACLCV